MTIEAEAPVPPQAPPEGRYRPHLAQGPLTFRAPFDPQQPGAVALRWNMRDVRPAIDKLQDGGSDWTPVYDLLASDPLRNEFVVEMESEGTAQLRFGDGLAGRKPPAGARFKATYRIGNGPSGNVGAEALGRVVLAGSGITRVRNPLPASGGTRDPPQIAAGTWSRTCGHCTESGSHRFSKTRIRRHQVAPLPIQGQCRRSHLDRDAAVKPPSLSGGACCQAVNHPSASIPTPTLNCRTMNSRPRWSMARVARLRIPSVATHASAAGLAARVRTRE